MSGIQGHLAELRSFSRCQMGRIPWIMGLVFLLAALGGYGVCMAYPQLAEALLAYFQQSISQSGVMDETGGLSFLALLLNNWSVMLFCILYGFLPFLFLPVLVAVTNAFIIGALAAIYHLNGISFLIFFSGIFAGRQGGGHTQAGFHGVVPQRLGFRGFGGFGGLGHPYHCGGTAAGEGSQGQKQGQGQSNDFFHVGSSNI